MSKGSNSSSSTSAQGISSSLGSRSFGSPSKTFAIGEGESIERKEPEKRGKVIGFQPITGAPSDPSEPEPPPRNFNPNVNSPVSLVEKFDEAGGLIMVKAGEGNPALLGAGFFLSQGITERKILLEITFSKTLCPSLDVLAIPDPPLGPVPVIFRAQKGWLNIEIPGWGTVFFLPGDPDYGTALWRKEQIEAKKFIVTRTLVSARDSAPLYMIAFQPL